MVEQQGNDEMAVHLSVVNCLQQQVNEGRNFVIFEREKNLMIKKRIEHLQIEFGVKKIKVVVTEFDVTELKLE